MVALWLLCGRYVVSRPFLCGFNVIVIIIYVVAIFLIYGCYVVVWLLLNGCYAFDMRLLCGCYAIATLGSIEIHWD